jgi:hypothetical protein
MASVEIPAGLQTIFQNLIDHLNTLSELYNDSAYQTVTLDTPDSDGYKLYSLVDSLVNFQKRVKKPRPNIESKVPAFIRWLKENGVDYDSLPVQIESYLNEGCGLVAKSPIKAGDLLVTIPSNLIFSTFSADKSGLDKILPKALHVSFKFPVSISIFYHIRRLASII